MRGSRAAAAVILMAAAALAGCGDGGSDDPPGSTAAAPLPEYVASANAACRAFADEKAALRALVPDDRAAVLDWLRRSATLLDREVAAVRAIPAPAEVRADVDAGLTRLTRAARLFEGARERIAGGADWEKVVAEVLPRLQAQGAPAGRALTDAGLVECAT